MKKLSRVLFGLIFLGVSICCLPLVSYAELGVIHYYAGPGQWATDFPDGWISQHHIRTLQVDDWYDDHGKEQSDLGGIYTGLDEVEAIMYILKLGHNMHFGDRGQWQWQSVLIVPYAQMTGTFTDATAAVLGLGSDYSDTGMGDPWFYNAIGWHNKSKTFHISPTFLFTMPFGSYDRDSVVNVGTNRHEIAFFLNAEWRVPIGKRLLMFDIGQNYRIVTENHDINLDERDTAESNLLVTWFTAHDRKLGFFVQFDYLQAVNDTELNGVSWDDDDAWSFAVGGGFAYWFLPNANFMLKYSEDVDGEEMREDKAWNCMMTWKF